MTNRRVRRPHGELVQHAAVVDWQRWSEGGWATSAPARCVGVGPVAPPQNALGFTAMSACSASSMSRRDNTGSERY
jgi:hypothetical protein